MKTSRIFTSALSGILACWLLVGSALGEEALPQMVKVTFPPGSAAPIPEDPKENYEASESGYSEDDSSYHDDTLDVRLHSIRAYNSRVIVAFVQIADPAQLRTEQSRPYPSQTTIRVDQITKRVKAVLAVNADWFSYHNAGIVYRNGKRLRNRPDEEFDALAIDVNGDFHIVRPMTEEGYAQLAAPIANSFAFGPALVIHGEIQEIVDRKETFVQRMAIGQVAPLSYVLVAADGPDQEESEGLSLPQLAELMHGLGAHTAYNLDGGQSTSMLMHQTKVNGSGPKNIRSVGDIIYFTTAIADK